MGKCPKCKTEINRLIHFQSGEQRLNFVIGIDNSPQYDDSEFCPDFKTNDYECPECMEIIATTEEGAIDILKEE